MLAALAELLIAIHVLGAALGVGGVTYAEIFYTKAVADGKIDRKEREYFATTYWALRWGMTTVLLSGIALMAVQYFLPDSPDAILYAPLWMQNTLALVITVAGWLMTRDSIRWWLGSAVAFAGWWLMLILDAARDIPISYPALIAAYIALVFLSGGFWGYARVLARERYEKRRAG